MCLVTSSNNPSVTSSAPSQKDGLRKRSSSLRSTETVAPVGDKADAVPSHSAAAIVGTFQRVDKNEILNYYTKTTVLRDFFTPGKPWVLVPNGSFMGYFDWVPLKLRVGPWHPVCAAYMSVLTLWVYYECAKGFATDPFPEFEPVQAWTWFWYYNVAAFAWTSLMVHQIFCSGMGWTSWGMYTIWSWTFTTLRHGLCAAAPFRPEWNTLNEQIRFPMLVQATITFGVWNAVIGPSIYAQMTTPEMKESFNGFFGSFLYKQLHVYNIIYATVNGIWGSPGRSLTKADFSVALAFCMLYAYFYLVALDRMGVHYYVVFSPRTPFALVSWSLLFACYYACFPLWNILLEKYA